MAKHWQTYEHPSDLGLMATADSLAELFEAMGDGLGRQVCEHGVVRSERETAIEITSDDAATLLIDFLSELLRLFAIERFLPARVTVRRIDERHIWAIVQGETYDPSRHELGPEIKAVTYHLVEVAQRDGQWHAQVLLDL